LFSKYFAEMRIWLDARKIEPVHFCLSGGSGIGLDIGFSSREEADPFFASVRLRRSSADQSAGLC
jgi:hypothetical protein